ncbi:MAG TPA: tRNA pseudouridine(38-40) synthase TruA [Desulfatiglandales bacterium]|nr:tRNA pseudouridine(38-40) synthase TruA [Desulfatiglandales bacterium]
MNKKKNLKMIVEYDGTRYHGWQRQKGDLTIQTVIEDSIRTMVGERVTLTGSGRTDTGVHALYQVCNFITGSGIKPDSMKRGLNSLLPDDIRIRRIEYVPLDFHARYSAKSKVYEYRILNRKDANVFSRHYTWHIRDELDIEAMRRSISVLIGRHDFSSFRSSPSVNKDPVREMIRAELHGPRQGLISFLFEANGFLRHMVRNIIGTVVEVGKGKISLDEFQVIFQSHNRINAGIKAPPQGLFLKMVKY